MQLRICGNRIGQELNDGIIQFYLTGFNVPGQNDCREAFGYGAQFKEIVGVGYFPAAFNCFPITIGTHISVFDYPNAKPNCG